MSGERKSIIGAMISDENTVGQAIISAQDKKEARSQRVNLLIRPSVYSKVKKKCKRLNISINECINQFLEQWSEEE